MSIEDKIAKALVRKHAGYMTASGWFTERTLDVADREEINYKSAKLLLGDTEVICKIADEADLQVKGLNGHEELGPYEGMIFPQPVPRRVSFHMDKVAFPIDMIFVADDSRVSKIVENVEPGQPGQWGMPHVLAVIEMNGGFCAAHNIEVGTEVRQISSKTAQEKFPSYPRKDINPKMITPNSTKPEERFKGKDLVDKQVDSPAFSPLTTESNDGFDLTVDIHDEGSGIGPNSRPL